MSDIFVAAGISLEPDRIARALTWTKNTWSEFGIDSTFSWASTRVDDRRDWASALHVETGVRAIIGGRIALSQLEWDDAENSSTQGGLAARHVIHRYLQEGEKGLDDINGGALLLVIDPRKQTLHLRTDRMGSYPVFMADRKGVVISSHPDVLAAALGSAGLAPKLDVNTVAEFLATGTATQPYTYWEGIKQLEPASRYVLRADHPEHLLKTTVYWKPQFLDGQFIRNRMELVERLTASMRHAVRLRTLSRFSSPALLLSSGADSRTVLFAAHNPSAFTTYTLYDELNAETKGAAALSLAARAEHVLVQRDPDYYIENAIEAVRTSAGMWSIESAHYGGLQNYFLNKPPSVLFSGCYADYLLKGIAFNSSHYTLLGKSLPIKHISNYNPCWHHPHFSMSSKWSSRLRIRQQERIGDVLARGTTADPEIEYRRISPIVREPDAAGRLYLRRTTPFDSFLMDHGVLDIYGLMGADQKLNGIPFGMAVDRICGRKVRHVVNNNYGSPVGASESVRILTFLLSSLRRKIGVQARRQPYEIKFNSVATAGSWPHFPRVLALSEAIHTWFLGLPADHKALAFDILGSERFRWSLEDWLSREPMLLIRFYTLSLWLSYRLSSI